MTYHFRMTPTTSLHAGNEIGEAFLRQKPIPPSRWQSQDVSSKPEMAPRELLHTLVEVALPDDAGSLAAMVHPNLPWAEVHFQERVGGEPLNPPPSHEIWPHAQTSNAEHRHGEIFSHTYPERMWPKYAGEYLDPFDNPMHGIRYAYGDLEDVVQQLKKDPLTRQAYLPIWFPEDTGANEGQRVPCTLGYRFIIRGGKLDITYDIRSCDFMRHFADDVYMAGRLAQWMVERFNEDAPTEDHIKVGQLVMNITSFHIFEGDVYKLQQQVEAGKRVTAQNWAGLL